MVLEFTVVGRIVPADLRASLIDAATVVTFKVLALGMHQQIPVIVFGEDRRAVVKQIPADEVKIFPPCGSIDRQGEIFAALGSAMIA